MGVWNRPTCRLDYLLQFRLFSACNEYFRAVLDETLCSHLTKTGRAASDKHYMVVEVEEIRDFQIRAS